MSLRINACVIRGNRSPAARWMGNTTRSSGQITRISNLTCGANRRAVTMMNEV